MGISTGDQCLTGMGFPWIDHKHAPCGSDLASPAIGKRLYPCFNQPKHVIVMHMPRVRMGNIASMMKLEPPKDRVIPDPDPLPARVLHWLLLSQDPCPGTLIPLRFSSDRTRLCRTRGRTLF